MSLQLQWLLQFYLLLCLVLLIVIGSPAGLMGALSGLNLPETIRRWWNDRWRRRQAEAFQPYLEERMRHLNRQLELKNIQGEDEVRRGRIQALSQLLELVLKAQASGTSVEALASYWAILDSAGRPDPGRPPLPPAGGNGQLSPPPRANPGTEFCI